MLKNLLFISIVIILIIASIVLYFQGEIEGQKIDHVLEQCEMALDDQLKKNQMDALQLAIVLSQNSSLRSALENDDEDLGYEILSNVMNLIQANTDRFIRTQVITSNLDIFARSWDDIYAGMPLGDYRTDLEYFKLNKTPRTSIEVGRRLGIKATVPIYNGDTLLGFVEVISFFESITDFFSSIGIDLYVLMKQDNLDTAVLMRDNLLVRDFVVAHRNYNHSHISTLKGIDFKELKSQRIIKSGDKYIFYKSMYNGALDNIGAYLFVLPHRYLEYFKNPEDEISFLINVTRGNLYNVVKEENRIGNSYDKHSIESLLYFKDIVSRQEREELLHSAYIKLDAYSKDELIQLMLDKKIVKKIDGKIK